MPEVGSFISWTIGVHTTVGFVHSISEDGTHLLAEVGATGFGELPVFELVRLEEVDE